MRPNPCCQENGFSHSGCTLPLSSSASITHSAKLLEGDNLGAAAIRINAEVNGETSGNLCEERNDLKRIPQSREGVEQISKMEVVDFASDAIGYTAITSKARAVTFPVS